LASPPTTSATPVDAWLELVDAPEAMARSVMRGLGAIGVRLRRRDPGRGRPRNGVIAFDGSAAAAVDCIRELAAGGTERILALSTSAGVLGEDSWALLRAGAADVFCWSDPATSARQVAERLRRWQTIDELVACRHIQEFLVGDSPAWQAVLREAVEVARFTDASVLITGESGTGKERVAQLIHELDPRPSKKRLVVLDCSTVVPSLSGSEFFGHERGAFTGAAAAREGAFELADGGTLFLDEVGELPVPLQAELLRVIQEGTFKRVGSNTWRKSTFRLVCATNRDLAAEQARGSFRNDFYYRIAAAPCTCRACESARRTSCPCSGTSSASCTRTAPPGDGRRSPRPAGQPGLPGQRARPPQPGPAHHPPAPGGRVRDCRRHPRPGAADPESDPAARRRLGRPAVRGEYRPEPGPGSRA
jgi:hypothetical protein